MQKIFPKKLAKGNKIAVIAPSRTMKIISPESRKIANAHFQQLGLELTFGKHIEEADDFASSSVKSRLADLHNAFADKSIAGIITVIGGFNSNQLLDNIDWELVKNNPKIFCGFSDITALNNAIFAKTGLVTYSGPHYSTFGQKLFLDYTLEYFKKCLFSEGPFAVAASPEWTDDKWFLDQDDRNPEKNKGYAVLNEGKAKGTILGSNLCTFNLLQGTKYMPSLKDSVLFLEDDYESQPYHFDRDLQSLIHLPDFRGVKGIVIGRFQRESHMELPLLKKIIAGKPELAKIPVVANADFGHTEPRVTFPVGGSVIVEAHNGQGKIEIVAH